MGIFSNKSSYYDLLNKSIKKEYDKNYCSEFNKTYSLRKNRFNKRNKNKKYRTIKLNEFPNWKTYLLSRLYPDLNKSWQFLFYNSIDEENFENQYLFQNEMFLEDFSLLNLPKLIIKNTNKNFQFETVLFPLDGEEISRCSTKSLTSINNSDKSETITNDDKNNLSCHLNIEMSNEIYYSINEYSSYSDKENINGSNDSRNSKRIAKDQKENKSNIAHIKKFLVIILKQLKNELHPITRIIKEFSEHFTSHINDSISKIKNNKFDALKKEIIKEVLFVLFILVSLIKIYL